MTKRESYLENIKAIIAEYLNTPDNQRSLTKLSKKYGIKRQTIAKYLRLEGYDVINYQNLCRINETIFDTIDTEEKAYWLGFIFADGNISTNGYRFELNLSNKDRDHMIKLKNFLNFVGEIKMGHTLYGDTYKPMCRISIRNKHLWSALNSKGCVPNKTLVLKFPNENIFSNKTLIYDFIRGYCDGDGTLGLYNHSCKIGFAGTYKFLKSIESFLGIKGVLVSNGTKNKPSKIYVLKYSALKARQVARLLYENSTISLTRKYNIFKSFCHFEEESSIAKSSKIGRSWNANTEVSLGISKGPKTP